MRKLPVVLAGALLGLTATSPAWAAGAAVNPGAAANPTPAATPAATPTPTPTPSAAPTPTVKPTPGPGGFDGNLIVTPGSVAPGAKVSVKPAKPCVPPDGSKVNYVAAYFQTQADLNAGKDTTESDVLVRTSASGEWAVTLTLPRSAKPGSTYVVEAGCVTEAAVNDPNGDPFQIYYPKTVAVASTVSAPVATPVVSNPKFTG